MKDDLFDDSLEEEILGEANRHKPPSKPKKGSKPKPKKIIDKSSDICEDCDACPNDNDPVVEFAIKKGQQEIEVIIAKLDELASTMDDCAIGEYFNYGIQYLAEYIQSVDDLISNQVTLPSKNSAEMHAYKMISKKKSEILATIFNKYSDDFKGGN